MTKTTIILLQNEDFTMPKSCSDCLFCRALVDLDNMIVDSYDCRLLDKCVDQYGEKDSKPNFCPIKSVECDRIEDRMFVD